MLCQLPDNDDPNLLSRHIPCADAGIYRISDSQLLLQSVDFFTPVVDDPYQFGAIAAANALSDIFAMGGQPLTAMNIVAFPSCLETDVLTAILKGGIDKVHEAGATLVGGHSIEDEEPKYGLAVTGLVHPDRLITSVGCQPGDQLILTKPLGTGLVTTALKARILQENDVAQALFGMARLNRNASQIMQRIGISACTDITGFGLLGHALEMAEASQVQLVICTDALPAYPFALDMADTGLVPEGSHRNRQHYGARLRGSDGVEQNRLDLLADPQTSGGLLIAVPPERSQDLLNALCEAGEAAALIGEIADGGEVGTMQLI